MSLSAVRRHVPFAAALFARTVTRSVIARSRELTGRWRGGAELERLADEPAALSRPVEKWPTCAG